MATARIRRLAIPVVVVLLLAAVRLPTVWYRMGSQDEQWYAVPGWTIAREGVPRIPYAPVDDPQSVFSGADRLLFTLPPAYFYVQAVMFSLFPAGYGTARLASWLAGAATLLLLYRLMRQLDVRDGIAIGGLTLCALGRAFYFPWQESRPDMLCAMFGVAAILCTLIGLQQRRRPFIALAGFLTGLGLLTHPFALVFILQVGGLLLFSNQPIRCRVEDCVLSGMCCVFGLLLWGPLIALDPGLFWTQFSNNVLSRSGPGIVGRLLWPWPFVPTQAALILERIGIIQSIIAATSLVAGVYFLRTSHSIRIAWLLAASAIYLHIASIGEHPAQGYLCYTWAMQVLLLVTLIEHQAKRASASSRSRGIAAVLMGVLALLLLPGSGLRPSWVYATHHADTNYNVRKFCEALNSRLPSGSRLIVSPELVFEFERLGRKPVNASISPAYHTVEGIPFDYLIASRQALSENIPDTLGTTLLWSAGIPDDPLACYAEVSTPDPAAKRALPWPRSLATVPSGVEEATDFPVRPAQP